MGKKTYKKKRTLKKKKKTQKTAFTFPLKFIVSDLIKQSTKSCLIVTLKLAESCRFSKDRQRPIRRLQSGDDAWQQFHLPPSHHCHLFLYLSTRAAPTGYLQDCLSLDAENDCHPPPLSFRHFFSPSPAKLNYDHWVLACVHICIHGYICMHFLYTHLYIYRRIHNPRIGCCASAVSFRLISPGPPCPWWSLVLYRLKITSLINHITATLSSSWLLKAGTAGKKKNIYRFLGSPVGMVRNPLYIFRHKLPFHTMWTDISYYWSGQWGATLRGCMWCHKTQHNIAVLKLLYPPVAFTHTTQQMVL